MDISNIAKKLSLADNNLLIQKAAEFRRLCDAQFDSSIIGVGEICKAVICLEIAASRLQVIFDRQTATKLSGMSERAYSRSFNTLQSGLGVRSKLNIKELAIQFGCIKMITIVQKGISAKDPSLSLLLFMKYKEKYLASLPVSRRANTDFTKSVFSAAAFYLCAKKQKLKLDKLRLIEVCGTSESEFSCVMTSMMNLCFDFFGVSKEKKDPKQTKRNRALLDVLPKKRRNYDSSEDEPSCYKRQKKMEESRYEDCKSVANSSEA